MAWLILLTVVLLFYPVFADTVTLTSVADSEIHQLSPDNNFGTLSSMVSGALGAAGRDEIRRGLLRFNLSGQIPPGSIINSVTVNLTVVKIPSVPAPSVFDLRQVLQSWDELQVTWNSRSSGNPWQTPGATGAADSSAAPSSSVLVSGLGSYAFPSTSQLVADVQVWVNDGTSSFGWLLLSESESTPYTARHFATREDPSHAPTLVVNFSAAPPVIQTPPRSQTVNVGDGANFTVVATGTPPLSYQWLFDGSAISGATNSSFGLSNIQTNDAGDYSVIVSNPGGSTPSQAARLTVLVPIPGQPTVTILAPTNAAVFPANVHVEAIASALAITGAISQVQFLLNSNLAGISMAGNPFGFDLGNLLPGQYSLVAVATDTSNLSTTSSTVSFSVIGPPTVSLTQPETGSRFGLGTNITLSASGGSSGSQVTNVLFLAAGTQVGQSQTLPSSIVWRPTTAGSALLAAVATDALSQSATSAPVAIRIFLPDAIPPRIVITGSPPDFARLTSAQAALAGTASDNIGVDRVEVQVNDGAFQSASGTNTWSALAPLAAGMNTVRIRSVDLAGNVSRPATRFFTYVVSSHLTVEQTGNGSITPALGGQSLEIGKVFSLRAMPGGGQVFAGWTVGASNFNRSVLNFEMRSNLTITASFIPNPFLAVAGLYNGIFVNSDTDHVTIESSGSIILQSGKTGVFSGKLGMSGTSYPFRGQFDTARKATVPVLRHRLTPVVLALEINLSGGTGEINGFVTNSVAGQEVVSILTAKKPGFSAADPAPQAGRRSFVLIDAAGQDAGSGEAFITPAGRVTLRGRLNDGQQFIVPAPLAADGSCAFDASFERGTEALVGWIFFTKPADGVEGLAFWIDSGPNGFARPLDIAPSGR